MTQELKRLELRAMGMSKLSIELTTEISWTDKINIYVFYQAPMSRSLYGYPLDLKLKRDT